MARAPKNKTQKVSFVQINQKPIGSIKTASQKHFLRTQGNPESIPFRHETSSGVIIKQTIAGMGCTYCLSSKQTSEVNITKCSQFDPCGNGEKLWNELKTNGEFTEKVVDNTLKCKVSQTILRIFFQPSIFYSQRFGCRNLCSSICRTRISNRS